MKIDDALIDLAFRLRAANARIAVLEREREARIALEEELFRLDPNSPCCGAQRDMAAKSKEDFEHWHHIAVADVIDELASRLRASQGEKEIG